MIVALVTNDAVLVWYRGKIPESRVNYIVSLYIWGINSVFTDYLSGNKFWSKYWANKRRPQCSNTWLFVCSEQDKKLSVTENAIWEKEGSAGIFSKTKVSANLVLSNIPLLYNRFYECFMKWIISSFRFMLCDSSGRNPLRIIKRNQYSRIKRRLVLLLS